jgi:peroxiredoxin
VVRTLTIGGWKIEFYRRSTFLIDERAVVVGVWPTVRVRGHALEVLAAACALPFRAGSG